MFEHFIGVKESNCSAVQHIPKWERKALRRGCTALTVLLPQLAICQMPLPKSSSFQPGRTNTHYIRFSCAHSPFFRLIRFESISFFSFELCCSVQFSVHTHPYMSLTMCHRWTFIIYHFVYCAILFLSPLPRLPKIHTPILPSNAYFECVFRFILVWCSIDLVCARVCIIHQNRFKHTQRAQLGASSASLHSFFLYIFVDISTFFGLFATFIVRYIVIVPCRSVWLCVQGMLYQANIMKRCMYSAHRQVSVFFHRQSQSHSKLLCCCIATAVCSIYPLHSGITWTRSF